MIAAEPDPPVRDSRLRHDGNPPVRQFHDPGPARPLLRGKARRGHHRGHGLPGPAERDLLLHHHAERSRGLQRVSICSSLMPGSSSSSRSAAGRAKRLLSSFPLPDLDDDLAGENGSMSFRSEVRRAIRPGGRGPGGHEPAQGPHRRRGGVGAASARNASSAAAARSSAPLAPVSMSVIIRPAPGAGDSGKVLGCMPLRRIHPGGVRPQSAADPGPAAQEAS